LGAAILVTWCLPKIGAAILLRIRVENRLGHVASVLAEFLDRRVPLSLSLEALALVEKPLRRGTLDRAALRTGGGVGLGEALALEQTFPEEVLWALSMAERRGTLPQALREIARRYEEKAQVFTAFLQQVAGPLALMASGSLLGVIVLALFLPIVKLQQALMS
jgi:type II secretory pathway component PulF